MVGWFIVAPIFPPFISKPPFINGDTNDLIELAAILLLLVPFLVRDWACSGVPSLLTLGLSSYRSLCSTYCFRPGHHWQDPDWYWALPLLCFLVYCCGFCLEPRQAVSSLGHNGIPGAAEAKGIC